MSELTVRLMRGDATPWGFRLGGGKDLGYPICVQRVSSRRAKYGRMFIFPSFLQLAISSPIP